MENGGSEVHEPTGKRTEVWVFRIDGSRNGCEAALVDNKKDLQELQAKHYSMGLWARLVRWLKSLFGG